MREDALRRPRDRRERYRSAPEIRHTHRDTPTSRIAPPPIEPTHRAQRHPDRSAPRSPAPGASPVRQGLRTARPRAGTRAKPPAAANPPTAEVNRTRPRPSTPDFRKRNTPSPATTTPEPPEAACDPGTPDTSVRPPAAAHPRDSNRTAPQTDSTRTPRTKYAPSQPPPPRNLLTVGSLSTRRRAPQHPLGQLAHGIPGWNRPAATISPREYSCGDIVLICGRSSYRRR